MAETRNARITVNGKDLDLAVLTPTVGPECVDIRNDQLDDMILLRSDGTPTYMHAVVVDDHDMGVTHISRGDDHLTNAARQAQVYAANGWALPVFAHIPLIHGTDGKGRVGPGGRVGVAPRALEHLVRVRLAPGGDLVGGGVAGIGGAGGEHLARDLGVAVGAPGLADRVAVPVEAEPRQPLEDRRRRLGRRAGAIRVLDPEQEAPSPAPGVKPVE